MVDYIGISKPLAVVGVTPKPEINYFYGPWGSVAEALDNIPQLARTKGLTVGIIEDSKIVEYWFKDGVELVLKSVDPSSVYTTGEIHQIINGLENTYVVKEVGKSLIENTKISKLDDLPSSVFSQAEIQQIIDDLEAKIATKVTAVTNQRLITKEEVTKLASAITATAFEEELSKKVDIVPGAGLITDTERDVITNAVTHATLSTGLYKKVDKLYGSRLITEQEAGKIADSVTSKELENGLSTKVTAVPNQRLITEQEATKLASAVTSGDLGHYSLKNTEDLEEAVEVSKEERQYIKFFDEVNGIEKKISMSNFILSISNPIYPTARALVGKKNGINETFYSEYNYISGSEKLNINGSIYYLNSGFYKEGDKIILSGAPIPEAGDFMFLEAIYLD